MAFVNPKEKLRMDRPEYRSSTFQEDQEEKGITRKIDRASPLLQSYQVAPLGKQSEISIPERRVLVYSASWGAFSASYVEGTFYKDSQGLVHLEGLVSKSSGDGIPAANNVIGTLPDGYKPVRKLIFPVATGQTFAAGTIQMEVNGDITWQSGNNTETDFTSLSGIVFLPRSAGETSL